MQESFEEVEPPEQTQLDSMVHELLQPSPLFVFPSSHFSVPALRPSPHWVTQVVGVVALFW